MMRCDTYLRLGLEALPGEREVLHLLLGKRHGGFWCGVVVVLGGELVLLELWDVRIELWWSKSVLQGACFLEVRRASEEVDSR